LNSSALLPFISGFFLGGSLIVAIGAQNAFILRMGLLRQHVFRLCLFCAVSDAILIVVGIAGLGAFVDASPKVFNFIAIAGALFLFAYALMALKRASNPEAMKAANSKQLSLSAALAICASFTWLNPHVYLDTVVLVGGYSAQYEKVDRLYFGIGCVLASFVWFFGLGFGAKYLRKFFEKPVSWQILDAIIAIIMTILAFSLLRSVF